MLVNLEECAVLGHSVWDVLSDQEAIDIAARHFPSAILFSYGYSRYS